jgi:hypothetical protein
MVVSIVGLVLCGGVVGIVGALMGHAAKRRIRETGEGGDGLATAGIVIGWISFGLFIIGVLLFIAIAIGAFSAASNSSGTTY